MFGALPRMAAHEKTPEDPLIGFRCDQKTSDEFHANIKLLGWSKPNLLRVLVEGFNILVAEHGKKLQWPPVVVATRGPEYQQDANAALELNDPTDDQLEALADRLYEKFAAKFPGETPPAPYPTAPVKTGAATLIRRSPRSHTTAPDSNPSAARKVPKTDPASRRG